MTVELLHAAAEKLRAEWRYADVWMQQQRDFHMAVADLLDATCTTHAGAAALHVAHTIMGDLPLHRVQTYVDPDPPHECGWQCFTCDTSRAGFFTLAAAERDAEGHGVLT